MSESSHPGSIASYVIGFILSLVFTAIPYYLVTEKVLHGNALLATIIAIAMLQMAIQIFFFLHLGRGPKPLYNIVFFVGTAGAIGVVVLGSIFIMNNLHYNMSPDAVTKALAQKEGIAEIGGVKTGACEEVITNHQIVVKDGKATPDTVDAKLCDTLTFINEDDGVRTLSFGSYPAIKDYSGEEVSFSGSRPKTIALNKAGSFMFHDRNDPDMTGAFTVAP